EGTPLTDRTSDYTAVMPDLITIYRQAICAICRTEAEVEDQVRHTAIHEVAHHFGIDDDRLDELGWKGLGRDGCRLALRNWPAPRNRPALRRELPQVRSWRGPPPDAVAWSPSPCRWPGGSPGTPRRSAACASGRSSRLPPWCRTRAARS